MISRRTKAKAKPLLVCAERAVADDLEDRDGWPIRVTAGVACRRHSKLWSGTVIGTFRDHNGREIVEVRCGGTTRLFRPGEVRVQRQRR
jgi:hypothetical protein